MLSHWVDTAWTRQEDGALSGRPLAPLPDALLRLGQHPGDLPTGLSGRARAGRFIRLLAGAGYGRRQCLAADVAMLFDAEHTLFRIETEELRRLDRRWRDARFTFGDGLPPTRAGIGGTLEAYALSPALAARLRPADARLYVSTDQSLWSARPAGPARALPDALVFHDDTLPVPITLMVEATTACTYRCGFCYGRHLAQRMLGLPAFLAMLDDLPALAAVEFTGEGEPLLNKNLPAMIRACKARGAFVHLTTNGSRMTPERAALICDLGIDVVATSMESLDPASFARLRPGGELAEVKNAMALLAGERQARGRGPDLLLWVTLLRSSLHEIDAFLDYAAAAGFARVEFQVLNRLAAYRRFYTADLAAEMLEAADLEVHRNRPTTSARARLVIDELLAIHGGRRCDIFMGAATADSRGEVTPCRLLKAPQHPSVGNLAHQPLEEIWADPGFAHFRFTLQHGVVLNACDGCAYVAGA
ncbi:radical SAM protein [Xanthobacteraceae bacterium A53D]